MAELAERNDRAAIAELQQIREEQAAKEFLAAYPEDPSELQLVAKVKVLPALKKMPLSRLVKLSGLSPPRTRLHDEYRCVRWVDNLNLVAGSPVFHLQEQVASHPRAK